MKKHSSQDGTKVYQPRQKLSPSGMTNVITDPDIINGEYSAVNDENVALAKKWVDENEK